MLVAPVQNLAVDLFVGRVWVTGVLIEAARGVDPRDLGDPVLGQDLVRVPIARRESPDLGIVEASSCVRYG